jgi:flagellar operon protein
VIPRLYPASFPRPVAGRTAADLQVEGGFADSLESLLRPKASPGARPADLARAEAAGGLRFSHQARTRLEGPGLALSEADLDTLTDGVERLAASGARESLVLMDQHAFVVGVPERTVIAAMSRGEATGNIFTQIDSTLLLR